MNDDDDGDVLYTNSRALTTDVQARNDARAAEETVRRAAPDLLAALKEIAESLETGHHYLVLARIARTAIAKAER